MTGPARPDEESTCARGKGLGVLRKPTGANGRTRFSKKSYRKPVLFLQKSPKIFPETSGSFRHNLPP